MIKGPNGLNLQNYPLGGEWITWDCSNKRKTMPDMNRITGTRQFAGGLLDYLYQTSGMNVDHDIESDRQLKCWPLLLEEAG